MPDEARRARSDSENLLLLGVELFVGQQTLLSKLTELLQLRDV
jgi:hypothetical protein